MDSTRIKIAIEKIEENTKALKWLEQYGANLNARDRGAFSIGVRLDYASSCDGSTEAAAILSSLARFDIEELVKRAINNCRNTIEIERNVIMLAARAEGGAE